MILESIGYSCGDKKILIICNDRELELLEDFVESINNEGINE